MHGYFDQKRLFLDLEISGHFPQGKKAIKAQIDTGYDGELTLPFSQAFPLGLILAGTKKYTIADGSIMTNIYCYGQVAIGNKKETIIVDIIPNGGILIGLPLLEKLGNVCQIDFVKKQIKFK